MSDTLIILITIISSIILSVTPLYIFIFKISVDLKIIKKLLALIDYNKIKKNNINNFLAKELNQ